MLFSTACWVQQQCVLRAECESLNQVCTVCVLRVAPPASIVQGLAGFTRRRNKPGRSGRLTKGVLAVHGVVVNQGRVQDPTSATWSTASCLFACTYLSSHARLRVMNQPRVGATSRGWAVMNLAASV